MDALAWFLSNHGPDAENKISSLYKMMEDSSSSSSSSYEADIFYVEELDQEQFPHLKEYRLGVELLTPKHEKLHLEFHGLSSTSSTAPLTPKQQERWINAFNTLTACLTCVNVAHSSVIIK